MILLIIKKITSMKNNIRLISFIYLVFLSIAFLIPLDFYSVRLVIGEEHHPSNNTSYIIHLILFFILYFLFYFSFLNKYKVFLFCLIYSILIEILQIFTSRGFQFYDVIFNIIGLLLSFIFLLYFFKKNI